MDRKKFIIQAREKRMTYEQIGKLLNISRQRVHQILTDYHSPSSHKQIPPLDHKILTIRKLKAFGFETYGESPIKNGIKSGGVDYVREWVRIRDKHTCQICFKVWEKGKRRFDVHHLDEERESSDNNPALIKGRSKWDKNHMDRMITLCHKCHLNLDHIRLKFRKTRVVEKVWTNI